MTANKIMVDLDVQNLTIRARKVRGVLPMPNDDVGKILFFETAGGGGRMNERLKI